MKTLFSLCSLFALFLFGCGTQPTTDYSDLELIEVSGRVTLNGEPVSLVTVAFESEDGSYSYGKTDGDGQYRLMFNSEKSGCLPGQKVVRITTIDMTDGGDEEVDEDALTENESDVLIPAKYNTDSELTANVSASKSTFDFELLSDG